MPATYQWSGKTVKGAITSGEMVAGTKDEVIAQLRRKNITATLVTEKAATKKGLLGGLGIGGKVSDKDIVVFTRQFSTMIDAGLPLVQGLEILSEQVENKNLAKNIAVIKADVESGSTYADALKKHPKIFSELYVNMVAAGEAGGILDTILNRLAAYIEKAMKLKKKVKGAMIYPAVVTSVAVLVIAVIMIFVIPTFTQMFASLGGTLPLPTRIVVGMSNFIAGVGGIFVAGLIVAIIVSIVQVRKTEKGKKVIDSILL